MEHLALILCAAISGAFLYRFDGSDGEAADKLGRAVIVAFVGVLVMLLTGSLMTGALCALGYQVSRMIPHGKYYAIGVATTKDPDPKPFQNVLAMVVIGLLRSALYSLPILLVNPDAFGLLLLGALHGPAYFAGYKLNGKFGLIGTQWGELFTGAYIFGGLAAILGA